MKTLKNLSSSMMVEADKSFFVEKWKKVAWRENIAPKPNSVAD